MIFGWLAHFFGLDNLSGPYYGFWSGIGSDLGELSIIVAGASIWWRHTCHAKGCYRIGRRAIDGTSYVVCGKHHPVAEPTHAEIIRQHKEKA